MVVYCAYQALLDQIDRLNLDPAVHGIIVQVKVRVTLTPLLNKADGSIC
jgi:hypothetical protein